MVLILTLILLVCYGVGLAVVGVSSYVFGIIFSGYSRKPLNKSKVFWSALLISSALGASSILKDAVSWNHIPPIFAVIAVGFLAGFLYGGLAARKES